MSFDNFYSPVIEVIVCPYCYDRIGHEDTKGHLHLYLHTGTYHCFRCLAHGWIDSSKELTSHALLAAPPKPTLDDMRLRIKSIFSGRASHPVINIPIMSVPVSDIYTPSAYNYLAERGITMEEIDKNHICVGMKYFDETENRTVWKWKDRILFPYYEGTDCMYIVGRSYTGRDPKYWNTAHGKGNYIYGLHNVNRRKAILCEGIISKIAAERYTGIPAISVLGKSVSDIQLYKIRSKCDTIFISFDGDVDDTVRKKLARRFIACGMTVYNIELPYKKDPDDLKQSYLDYFKASVEKGKLRLI